MRFLLNAAAALSVLLALATAGLWARSYWTCDRLCGGNYLVESEFGGMYLNPIVSDSRNLTWEHFPAGKFGVAEQDWFEVVRRLRPLRMFQRVRTRRWLIVAPHWFVVLAFTALPAYRLARRMRRRPQPGHCPTCGYDLRATPDRCPECGTIAAT